MSGQYYSGDLRRMDEDAYIVLSSKKDIIIREVKISAVAGGDILLQHSHTRCLSLKYA